LKPDRFLNWKEIEQLPNHQIPMTQVMLSLLLGDSITFLTRDALFFGNHITFLTRDAIAFLA
jgi:hypothetical protein